MISSTSHIYKGLKGLMCSHFQAQQLIFVVSMQQQNYASLLPELPQPLISKRSNYQGCTCTWQEPQVVWILYYANRILDALRKVYWVISFYSSFPWVTNATRGIDCNKVYAPISGPNHPLCGSWLWHCNLLALFFKVRELFCRTSRLMHECARAQE